MVLPIDNRFDLPSLKKRDGELKEAAWISDWQIQRSLADDCARAEVQARLKKTGQGVKGDEHPLEGGLLRAIVSELSVRWSRPPTRWLRRGGQRLAESSSEHRAMVEVYDRSGVDAFLQVLDFWTTLLRNAVVRVYASDLQRRVRLQIFGPEHVFRDPDLLGEFDDLRADRRFALKHAEGFELWARDEGADPRDPEAWSMVMVDDKGQPLLDDAQPFIDSGLRNPYPALPVVLVQDGLATGPWVPPKSSRTSYGLAVAGLLNELNELVRISAHSETVWEQSTSNEFHEAKASDMPKKVGPAIRNLLPPGVTQKNLAHSPRVEECISVLEKTVETWLRSESLPDQTFNRSQVVSALALRSLAAPLQRRQEGLRAHAVEDERALYRALSAVHNTHRGTWGEGVPALPRDVGLDVELAPVTPPQDPKELSEVFARRMALGGASLVDLVMAEQRLSRDEAIAWIARVARDRALFPVPGGEGLSMAAGPNLADPTDEPLNPAASVLDTVRAASGA